MKTLPLGVVLLLLVFVLEESISSSSSTLQSHPHPHPHSFINGTVLVTAGNETHIYNSSAGMPVDMYINDHTVVLAPDGRWHILGINHVEPADPDFEVNLGHAVSDNVSASLSFVQQPFALGAILPETHLWAPHIIWHNNTYHAFYCGGGYNRTQSMIRHAMSTDLYNWERLGTLFTGGVDGRDPMVMNLGPDYNNTWILYYVGTDPDILSNNVTHVTYFRTSTNLYNWTTTPGIAFRAGMDGSCAGGPTESPFVVRRGASFYLFSGTWPPSYSNTHVFVSQNPFDFGDIVVGNATEVGQIYSHAPEVVRDESGRWFITRCGWGQGGVYLAPLTWSDGLDNATTSFPPPSIPTGVPPNKFETNITLATGNSTSGLSGVSTFVVTSQGLQGGNVLSNAFFVFNNNAPSSSSPSSFNVEAAIRLITSSGNPDSTPTKWTRNGSAAALVFNIQDNDDPSQGSYAVNIFTPSSDGAYGGVKLFQFPYEVIDIFPCDEHSPIAQDEWYRLRVDVNNGTIAVYFGVGETGALSPVIKASNTAWKNGSIGLNIWQGSANFQNVTYGDT